MKAVTIYPSCAGKLASHGSRLDILRLLFGPVDLSLACEHAAYLSHGPELERWARNIWKDCAGYLSPRGGPPPISSTSLCAPICQRRSGWRTGCAL